MMLLEQIAAEMLAHYREPPRRWKLTGGLMLSLGYDDELDRLALHLMRKNVFPSPTEVRICRQVFEVPNDVRPIEAECNELKIIRLIWPRNGQMRLEEAEQQRSDSLLERPGSPLWCGWGCGT
jgi:hypothetical protein